MPTPPTSKASGAPDAAVPLGITPLEKMPAQQRFWRWFYALAGALLGLVGGVMLLRLVAEALDGSAGEGASAGVVVLVALLLGAVGWWYGSLCFARYQGSLHAGEGVVLHSGVWWRSEAWVPMARLQHLDVTQGPLDRLWGMATLTLNTAGTHDHRLRIKGLPVAQAHALRAALLPRTRSAHE